MIQRNFETAMAKGEAGESIIRSHLEAKGWIVYKPFTDGAHCFDMMSIKDKRAAVAIDVKAKARMTKWPATGIDERHFNEYSHFSEKYKMPFWVIFVDEYLGRIYGNTIDELEKPRVVDGIEYPWVMRGKIRIWPLAAMKRIGTLADKQMKDLTKFNQRNHEYVA